MRRENNQHKEIIFVIVVVALFLINVYDGFKTCPSLLETAGICIPTQKSCPSARCASAANTAYKGIDRHIFGNQIVALNHILK
jgi:hypothetical protein